MRTLRFRELSLVSLTLLMGAGVTLSACSSGSGSSSPSTGPTSAASQPPASSAPATSAPPPAAEPSTGPGAIAAITANWVAFFSNKTPVARRIALLQNGQIFAPIIRAQAGSGLAALASAKVVHVSLTSTSQAAVTYDILAGGQVGLPNVAGVAVYQNGVWVVGDASFCGLLKLQNGGSSTGLPAACKG